MRHSVVAAAAPVAPEQRRRPDSRADRFMRALLLVPEPQLGDTTTAVRGSRAHRAVRESRAHRAVRVSLVISGLRCIAMYLVVPLLVPVISFLGVVAGPVSIALSLVAMVSGLAGVRRFWISDHRAKWIYTWFMAFVFAVLTVFLVTDVTRLVN